MNATMSQPGLEPIDGYRTWAWWKAALLIVGIWSVPALLFTLLSYAQKAEQESGADLWNGIIVQAVMWYSWAAVTPIIFRLVRRSPFQRQRAIRRIAIHLGQAIVLSAAILMIVLAMEYWLADSDGRKKMEHEYLSSIPYLLIMCMIMYWVVVAVCSAIDNARRLREQMVIASRLEAQLARARLDALRSQLQPHFLFNTLNAIASLVRQSQRDAAVDTIARLSDLLRLVLEHRDEAEIPLAEEMELIECYLDIERRRFGERLRVDISIDDDAAACLVPTLLLQPLVENSIKHGVSRSRSGGSVTITAHCLEETLHLLIEDDCGRFEANDFENGSGVGLNNTRDRLRELYGDAHTFTIEPRAGGGVSIRIEIPCSGKDRLP